MPAPPPRSTPTPTFPLPVSKDRLSWSNPNSNRDSIQQNRYSSGPVGSPMAPTFGEPHSRPSSQLSYSSRPQSQLGYSARNAAHRYSYAYGAQTPSQRQHHQQQQHDGDRDFSTPAPRDDVSRRGSRQLILASSASSRISGFPNNSNRNSYAGPPASPLLPLELSYAATVNASFKPNRFSLSSFPNASYANARPGPAPRANSVLDNHSRGKATYPTSTSSQPRLSYDGAREIIADGDDGGRLRGYGDGVEEVIIDDDGSVSHLSHVGEMLWRQTMGALAIANANAGDFDAESVMSHSRVGGVGATAPAASSTTVAMRA